MKESIDKVLNGEMVGNMEEVKQLGKQMEHLRTERELEKSGRTSDPDQHEIAERNR